MPTPTPAQPRRAVARTVGVAALALALVACGPGDDAGDGARAGNPTGGSSGAASPAELDVAVVGDSLTAAGAQVTGGTSIVDGDALPGEGSWVTGADGAPLVVEGGWAQDGATSAEMRAGVGSYDADVLVVMAGTNDLLQDVPWTSTEQDLVAVVDTAQVDRVVLSAVPPLDEQAASVPDLNDRLAGLADQHGWQFVDPWTDFAVDGSYRDGASDDGVHPTPMVAFAVGRTIRDAVLDGAGG